MSLIPFPDIPDLPGVPAIPRLPELPDVAAVATTSLGMLEGMLWRSLQVETQWGIYDSAGNALGDPSQISGFWAGALESLGLNPWLSTLSTNSVDYSKETKISDFPVERGSFASYNKVELPANPVVTLCFMGSESDRTSFLDAIDAACKSTDLYTVTTPEKDYIDHSLERYNYQRRAEKGATLLFVEISLKEVRNVTATYTQSQIDTPKDVGADPAADNGKTQTTTPQTSTLKSLVDKAPEYLDSFSNWATGLLN